MKTALLDVSPILFLALRFSLATVALLVAVPRRLAGGGAQNRRARPGSAGAGVLVGIFLFSGYLLQTLGLRLTTRPEIGIYYRTDVGDGTFAGGARLSHQTAGFRGGRGAGGHRSGWG